MSCCSRSFSNCNTVNRGWTYEDIRSWIDTNVEVQTTSNFYDDTRGTTAEGTEWADRNRLQGSDRRVLYVADYTVSTPYPESKRVLGGGLSLKGNLSIRFGNR